MLADRIGPRATADLTLGAPLAVRATLPSRAEPVGRIANGAANLGETLVSAGSDACLGIDPALLAAATFARLSRTTRPPLADTRSGGIGAAHLGLCIASRPAGMGPQVTDLAGILAIALGAALSCRIDADRGSSRSRAGAALPSVTTRRARTAVTHDADA